MRKFKTVLGIASSLVVFGVMAMGSGESGVDQPISSVDVNNGGSKPGMELASENNEVEEASSEMVKVDEIVLYDENNIKITATGMEDGWFGTELKVLIENNTDTNLTFQTRKSCVNGYMVETSISAEVAAGKKVNDSITFFTSELKDCGIETIATMEFQFHIFDSETWDGYIDTDSIVVNTSAADTYVQEYDDSGDVILEHNGIKIVAKGLSTKDSIFGPGLILYIENESKEDICVQARDVSVNGFMIDTSMSKEVIVGKKAITALTFFDSSLEENSIDSFEEIEMSFHIFNADSWDGIIDSDVITINF